MADNQKLTLTVQVNAETGQLEVLGSKMKDVGNTAKNAFAAFLPAATAAGIIGFFASAVKGAEEQNQSMQRLKFTLQSTGQQWEKHAQQIDDWSKAIGRSTRFSDGEALQALDKLTRATGNVATAQQASQLAMGLAAKTGKDLAETTEFVNQLINKNERAVMMAHREYGVLAGNAHTAQEVLDSLSRTTGKAAFDEDNLTANTHKLANSFGQFKDTIGNAFAPAANFVIQVLTKMVQAFETLGTVIDGSILAIISGLNRMGEAIKSAVHLDFSGVKAAMTAFGQDIENINAAVTAQQEENEHKKTDAAIKGAEERIRVVEFETEAERQKREEQAAKIEQFEQESAQKIAAIGSDTLQKKNTMLNAEINSRKQKIAREITDETAKAKLLQKLDTEKFQRSAALNKAEQQLNLQKALDVVDINLQTLSILNSMGNQHNKAEVNRAKAILALEKSIAIARAIAAAMAAPPGVSQAIAAAQVGLIVAQFGQQMQAIDKAQSAFNSGQSSISISTPLDVGGGQTITDTFGGQGGGGVTPVIVGQGGGGAGIQSSGGGGGAGVIINVGGINVALAIESLAIDNVQVVMSKIYEAVRRGTVEGVQLAVALQNTANKNSGLAV